MNDDSEFKKVEDFIKRNRPLAPEKKAREAAMIWARINSHQSVRKKLWTPQFVTGVSVVLVLGLFFFSQFHKQQDELLYGSIIEQTFNADYEGEELAEVSDLLALSEKE